MAFWAQKASAAEIQKFVEPFKKWLSQHAKVVRRGTEDDDWSYMFIMTAEDWDWCLSSPQVIFPDRMLSGEEKEKSRIMRMRHFMTEAGYVRWMYVDYPDNTEVAVFWADKKDKITLPTIMRGAIRPPKLSYLITLTPEDFFMIIRILYFSQIINGDKLKLDLKSVGLDEDMLNEDEDNRAAIINRFFKKLRTNYTIVPEAAMKQWIDKNDLENIVDLEPTVENQLYAMQYITAVTQDDVYFFPTDSAIELAMDWPQAWDERYVVRPDKH